MPSSLGHPHVHLRVTDSTNDRARALAIAGAPSGTLVTASEQTAGRGRHGRRWAAPPGSALLATLVLRSPPPLLPLIAAVAVCEAVGEEAMVKWPNDIVIVRPADLRETDEMGSSPDTNGTGDTDGTDGTDETGGPDGTGDTDGTDGTDETGDPDGTGDTDGTRPGRGVGRSPSARPRGQSNKLAKLGGILVEGRPQEGWAVLGIGLNVAVEPEELPPELRESAATMGRPPSAIEPVLRRMLDALQRRLDEPAESVLEAYRVRDVLRGRDVAWSDGHGTAEGVDSEGRLVVALADGTHASLHAGEVHLRL